MLRTALALSFAVALGSAQTKPKPELWVAIGVSKPLFRVFEMEKMSLQFVVVNDGQTTVDPRITYSHLLINGVEAADWGNVIVNGLRTPYHSALPPGEEVSFGYQLGPRYFAKPGIYVVRWYLPETKSATLTFRVLP
jgi:hypothetical protein